MKQLNAKQIEQVKSINPWTSTSFHGNRKTSGLLPVELIKSIVEKKISRALNKIDNSRKSDVWKVIELITRSKETKGTNYFKVLIEGNTGIYYASPVYGHRDYNKSRIFEKNPETLKLMGIFNSIIFK